MSLRRFSFDTIFSSDVYLTVADFEPQTAATSKLIRLWYFFQTEHSTIEVTGLVL